MPLTLVTSGFDFEHIPKYQKWRLLMMMGMSLKGVLATCALLVADKILRMRISEAQYLVCDDINARQFLTTICARTPGFYAFPVPITPLSTAIVVTATVCSFLPFI